MMTNGENESESENASERNLATKDFRSPFQSQDEDSYAKFAVKAYLEI